jgi:propanol-preferring alcohol dehydrogenase
MKSMRLFTQKPISKSPFALVDLLKPAPAPGQVLLRVSVCGVCHTDLHTVEGDIHPPSLPVTPGHQVVARVEVLGEGVDNLSPGERVGVPWLQRGLPAIPRTDSCFVSSDMFSSKVCFYQI